jgi:hypothetical protein
MKKIIAAAILVAFTLSIAFADDLPDMPLKVTYRKAVMGEGYVIQFHNISEDLLPIRVTFENPPTKTSKEFRLNIPAFKTKEFGHLEGWTALLGDKITVENANYKTQHLELKQSVSEK